jgi:DNA polymerase IV (family X)
VARLNDTVEAALVEYADLLSILTDEPYKPRSYEKAARAVGGYPDDLATMDLKEILKIPSVGKSIGEKIDEFVRTGSFEALDELRAQIPPGVREMTEIPGLGRRRRSCCTGTWGSPTSSSSRRRWTRGRLAEVKGFGAKTEENIRRGIERMNQSTGRVLVSVAMDLADYFIERLGARKDVRRIEYAGSLRRMAETIGDSTSSSRATTRPG